MKAIQNVVLSFAVCVVMATAESAQQPERDPGALVRIVFDTQRSFVATGLVIVKAPDERVLFTNETAYACHDGKFRTALKPQAVRGKESADMAMSRSMNQVSYITCPSRNIVYVFYPVLNGYMEAADALAAFNKGRQFEKTEIAKDTVNGQPCFKCKLLVTAPTSGSRREFIVWEAAELNRFPIQVEFASGTNTVQVQFKDIQRGVPDPALFQPPPDSKYYATHDDLMTGFVIQMVQKMKGLPTFQTAPSTTK